MSQRLRERFANARATGKALFIPYVTAGYPTPAHTPQLLLAMEAGGADVIEIGMPFTDPLADGATIQHANQVALEQHVRYTDCLQYVREARARGLQAPVLFMGYYNPLLAYGEERACADAAAAGADGFIIVDLPADEAKDFLAACNRHDLSFVPLIAPTTREDRMSELARAADAFVYCVSVTGTTGGKTVNATDLPSFIDRVKAHTDVPIAIGFGVSTRAHVEAVSRIADAAVIGSAIIARIDAAGPDRCVESVREFVEDVSGR